MPRFSATHWVKGISPKGGAPAEQAIKALPKYCWVVQIPQQQAWLVSVPQGKDDLFKTAVLKKTPSAATQTIHATPFSRSALNDLLKAYTTTWVGRPHAIPEEIEERKIHPEAYPWVVLAARLVENWLINGGPSIARKLSAKKQPASPRPMAPSLTPHPVGQTG